MSGEPMSGGQPNDSAYRDAALRLLDERRRRSMVVGDDWLCAEAGWAFLLVFYAHGADDGEAKLLSEAAASLGVSEMQALRWMKVLSERGLVEEGASRASDRRFRLTEHGTHLMRQYLNTL